MAQQDWPPAAAHRMHFHYGLKPLIPYISEVKYLIPQFIISYAQSFGWNQEPLDDFDMLESCSRNGIVFLEHDLKYFPGIYRPIDGRPVIMLSKYLTGHMRSLVLGHEISHSMLDSSRVCLYGGLPGDKRVECRANIIPVCSVLPKTFIEVFADSELRFLFNYEQELIDFRRAVYAECDF